MRSVSRPAGENRLLSRLYGHTGPEATIAEPETATSMAAAITTRETMNWRIANSLA